MLCQPRRARVLRSRAMRAISLLALGLLLAAPAAHAQSSMASDSGRFVVFQGDTPVAHERFSITWLGDSLVIEAVAERTLKDEQGVRHPMQKLLSMVVDSRDFGLIRYISVEKFQGHDRTRGLVPGDTSITYYDERDGGGSAMRLVQPPGRLFVLDSQLFTLFEVMCRSLAPKTFATRRVQILALADSMSTPLATVTLVRPDTLRLGDRRVPARHYSFEDESAFFDLWADAQGRLMRLSHESGLRVEREPDPASPPRRRSRGARPR